LMGEGLNCLPRLVVELNTFARHAFHFLGYRVSWARRPRSQFQIDTRDSRTNFGFNMGFH
jgi:hypothetical protein